MNGVLIGCLYAPNGNPQPGPKFDYKLAWLERLRKHAATSSPQACRSCWRATTTSCPRTRTSTPRSRMPTTRCVQPQSRAAYATLLAQGWVDALRERHPDERIYTFWDYMRNRWPRDAGLRIDHLLLSASVAGRLVDAGVDRLVRGCPNASDHAPVWITLR